LAHNNNANQGYLMVLQPLTR